jgi:hypothetical protein
VVVVVVSTVGMLRGMVVAIDGELTLLFFFVNAGYRRYLDV